MRSLYKTNRQPGRNQFQYLKKMWSYRHMPPQIKLRGKIGKMFTTLFLMASIGYVAYLIYSLITPDHGLFKVSLFHLLD
ncbi:hypothetical protein HZA39_03830 [Candidatus Peregrinibacteria bacterium]|nr:hypothetical protein [Candidatus Peregrinibacteria bacterium]